MSRGFWYDYEWDFCSEKCWEFSEERDTLYYENKEKFNWSREEKIKYIQEIEDNPDGNERDNLIHELHVSMRDKKELNGTGNKKD